jgi:hypothetical protein
VAKKTTTLFYFKTAFSLSIFIFTQKSSKKKPPRGTGAASHEKSFETMSQQIAAKKLLT